MVNLNYFELFRVLNLCTISDFSFSPNLKFYLIFSMHNLVFCAQSFTYQNNDLFWQKYVKGSIDETISFFPKKSFLFSLTRIFHKFFSLQFHCKNPQASKQIFPVNRWVHGQFQIPFQGQIIFICYVFRKYVPDLADWHISGFL